MLILAAEPNSGFSVLEGRGGRAAYKAGHNQSSSQEPREAGVGCAVPMDQTLPDCSAPSSLSSHYTRIPITYS